MAVLACWITLTWKVSLALSSWRVGNLLLWKLIFYIVPGRALQLLVALRQKVYNIFVASRICGSLTVRLHMSFFEGMLAAWLCPAFVKRSQPETGSCSETCTWHLRRWLNDGWWTCFFGENTEPNTWFVLVRLQLCLLPKPSSGKPPTMVLNLYQPVVRSNKLSLFFDNHLDLTIVSLHSIFVNPFLSTIFSYMPFCCPGSWWEPFENRMCNPHVYNII